MKYLEKFLKEKKNKDWFRSAWSKGVRFRVCGLGVCGFGRVWSGRRRGGRKKVWFCGGMVWRAAGRRRKMTGVLGICVVWVCVVQLCVVSEVWVADVCGLPPCERCCFASSFLRWYCLPPSILGGAVCLLPPSERVFLFLTQGGRRQLGIFVFNEQCKQVIIKYLPWKRTGTTTSLIPKKKHLY